MIDIQEDYKTEVILWDKLDENIMEVAKQRSKAKSTRLRFCITEHIDCEGEDTSKWKVESPVFNQLFTEGKCKFGHEDCWHTKGYTSKIYDNPLWEDVIWEAHLCLKKNGPSDHVFLEDVSLVETDKDGVKLYQFHFGS